MQLSASRKPRPKVKMNPTRNIVQSTLGFETWLRGHITVRETDLEVKHQFMADDIFMFFRATFYRWCERWYAACPSLANAEQVLRGRRSAYSEFWQLA